VEVAGAEAAELTALGAVISRAAAAVTEMLLEAAPEDSADRARGAAAVAAPPALGLEAAEGLVAAAVVAAADGADKRPSD
jgi:hypothetical protein